MQKKFLKYWRIFWHFRRLRLMLMMQYRLNFFFWSFVSIMWTIFHYFFFGLLIGVKGELGGWSVYEGYVLFSVFTIVDSFIWTFLYHTMVEYTRLIYNGELSSWLLKPIDSQFILSTQTNSYNNIFRFFIGIFMLVWSLGKLGHHPSFMEVSTFLVLFSAGMLWLSSTWFFITTLSFWVERVENINEVMPTLRRIFQLPHTVYQGGVSLLFTVITPIALIVSLPSAALLGRASWEQSWYLVGSSIGMFVLARWFYHHSIKKYVGVGG